MITINTVRSGPAGKTKPIALKKISAADAVVADAVNASALGDVLLPFCAAGDAVKNQDLVDARGLIEGELAARAAARRQKADLDRLTAMLVLTPEELADAATYAKRDLEFHREVARVAGNSFLALMHEAFCVHVEKFLVQPLRSRRKREDALARHRPIIDAIAAGDADRARELARTHAQACLCAATSNTRRKLAP